MTAQQLLDNYGITIEVARDFIMSHLNDLNTVYNTCKQFGITNNMIAEIVASVAPGFNGSDVINFFASFGIDSTDLDSSNTNNNPSNSFDINNILGKTFYIPDEDFGSFNIEAPINSFTVDGFNQALDNDKVYDLIGGEWVLGDTGYSQSDYITNVVVNGNNSYTITDGDGSYTISIESTNDQYWTMQADTAYGTFYEELYLAPNDYILSYPVAGGEDIFVA